MAHITGHGPFLLDNNIHFPHLSYSCSKTCIYNHIVLLANVTLTMVTADYVDVLEQFQHVKQLNTAAEITHNRKTYFTCMYVHTYIRVLGHIPVSLIKQQNV